MRPTGPVVEPAVQELQLGLGGREPEEGERGAEVGEAPVHSLDDLVGPRQQRRWDPEAQDLSGLEVDDQLELCRLLDR